MEAQVVDTRTVRDLQNNGYTGLNAQLTKDILYLEQLSTTTSQPITNWPVIEMLKETKRGDKRAINKLFFDHIATEKKEVVGKMDPETFQKIQRIMFDASQRRKENALRDARYNLENCDQELSTRVHRVNEAIARRRTWIDRIDFFSNQTEGSVSKGFLEILENPFWVFEKVAFNKAYFRTKADVVIRYKSEGSAIDIQVNFGVIGIALDFVAPRIYALKRENNLILDEGHFHPFISCSGEICYGTYAEQAAKMLTNYEFGKLFELTASLLTSYSNSANPYVALGTFYDREKKGSRIIRETATLCKDCNVNVGDCECVKCTICESRAHETRYCEDYCPDCESDRNSCGCEEDPEVDGDDDPEVDGDDDPEVDGDDDPEVDGDGEEIAF